MSSISLMGCKKLQRVSVERKAILGSRNHVCQQLQWAAALITASDVNLRRHQRTTRRLYNKKCRLAICRIDHDANASSIVLEIMSRYKSILNEYETDGWMPNVDGWKVKGKEGRHYRGCDPTNERRSRKLYRLSNAVESIVARPGSPLWERLWLYIATYALHPIYLALP